MKKYRLSFATATFAYVLFGLPGTWPASVPQSGKDGQLPPPDQRRLRSSAGPGYAPAASWASRVGAAPSTGIVVTGTSDIVRFSLLDAAGALDDVAIPIVRCCAVLLFSLIAAPGSVVSVFVRTKLTVASAPPASGPYGFD